MLVANAAWGPPVAFAFRRRMRGLWPVLAAWWSSSVGEIACRSGLDYLDLEYEDDDKDD